MPKMKSSRAAKKRFKRTATGKIKRYQANKSHILTKKTAKRKRQLRGSTLVAGPDRKRCDRLLGGK